MWSSKYVAAPRRSFNKRTRAPVGFSRLFIIAGLLAFASGLVPAPAFALGLTTVSVSASVTTSPAGSPITLTATVASGAGTPDGTVLFVADLVQIGTTTLNGSGQATITTSGLSVGVHAVVVLYLGSANFLPSTSIALNINITLAVCTINVTASLTSVGLGAAVNLTATVSGSNGTPTGLITFQAGLSVLGNATLNGSGQGSLSVTTSLIGALLIEVNYAGDPNYLACIAPILTINVTQGSSSVALGSSANPAAPGAVVTFTASVSASGATPTGTVTFKDGAAAIGTASLNGSAQAAFSTSALGAGGHSITAVYGGDANFTGNTSAPLSEVINAGGAATTTTTLGASPNPAASTTPVTLTATVAGGGGTPTGTVSFRDNGAAIGTVSLGGSGVAALVMSSLAAGSHSVVATYNGDTNFAASSSSPTTVTINGGSGASPGSAGSTGTTLTSSANPATFGQPVVFTASVRSSAGTPTGTVAFMDQGRTIGTSQLSGGSASLTVSSLRVGPHLITAAYIGNASFTASVSSPLQQSIAAPPDSLKLRELQVVATRVAAQTSGDAIAGTIAAAVEEGLSGGDNQLITPSELGLRMTSAGYGEKDSKLPPSDWLVWSDLRQTSMTSGSGANSGLSGSQVNSFAGLTLRVTSDFVVGVFGGYEFFGYDVSTLSGRLRGDGATAGAYVGWRFLPGLRFDAGIARSEIGYEGTAGAATAQFSGTRTLFTTGLAGTFKLMPELEIEPSARFYGLWETEAAYQDAFGTAQASNDFSTGRTSVGAKFTYRLTSAGNLGIAPYLGAYADTYFGKDNAAAPVPTAPIMDGTSARLTGGVAFVTDSGARLTAGAEIGGLAGNFTAWSLRARGSLPF
jgi:hypothetical protein